MSKNEMLENLTKMARTTINDVVDTTELLVVTLNKETGEIEEDVRGQTVWQLKMLEDIEKGAHSAIKELTAGKQGLTIKMHDQMAAMKQISAMLGYDAPVKTDNFNTNIKTMADFYSYEDEDEDEE